ncbi:MAG: HD domain-containing phosphohydrolase [Nitrospinota bacterium]|nr:HD domain-containing phosphohydrolase [Nitrospinota bacterium]
MANTTVETINKLMDKPGAIESFFQLTVHDYYTYTHSVHVYIYSSMLTREIIGDENEALLKELGVGFLLHDIGKKGISPEILNKKGKLDDDEWEEIKKHPATGYDLLTEISGGLTEEVTQIVLQHHEKIDGSGYPKGLKEIDIGRFGRIYCIVDVYDALTTKRSYKEAMSKMTAFTITQDSPGHFDEKLLARFIRLAVPHLE